MKISEAFRKAWEEKMTEGCGHWAEWVTYGVTHFIARDAEPTNKQWWDYCTEELYGCLNSAEIKRFGITQEQISEGVKNGFIRESENFNRYNRCRATVYTIGFTKKGERMMIKAYDWNPNHL